MQKNGYKLSYVTSKPTYEVVPPDNTQTGQLSCKEQCVTDKKGIWR